MTPQDVFDHFGGRSPAAKALGVTFQAVQHWHDKGVIPETRQFHIEVVTGGILKADAKSIEGPNTTEPEAA